MGRMMRRRSVIRKREEQRILLSPLLLLSLLQLRVYTGIGASVLTTAAVLLAFPENRVTVHIITTVHRVIIRYSAAAAAATEPSAAAGGGARVAVTSG